MDYRLLGARLRQERLKHDWTQEALAEKIEVSHAYIGQIERGERSLTLDTLVRLANQLGVTVDDLLQEAIEKSNEHYVNKIKRMVLNRPESEQQMALDMLTVMFSHLDKRSSN
ncbi:helix-turn-helix domain-containing protein [Paenibacillus oenotherae]|uniref:Helix-turn-helix domain-containing protein n=1 Tax=Paenibacillus oenotherae TaxID=1435645 RepID=A0ABS7DC03_9BACL|nr:helix-turn-helix transcriptional regulator [Paenibacillus oenotherae]MBW7476678.1 helix-turn-helix domain-containing protein [Paenibacillus oenotherae]